MSNILNFNNHAILAQHEIIMVHIMLGHKLGIYMYLGTVKK